MQVIETRAQVLVIYRGLSLPERRILRISLRDIRILPRYIAATFTSAHMRKGIRSYRGFIVS
jgi:hypothetical protein